MDLLNFIKDASKKCGTTQCWQSYRKYVNLKEHIQKLGLPGTDNVNIDITDDKITVTG